MRFDSGFLGDRGSLLEVIHRGPFSCICNLPHMKRGKFAVIYARLILSHQNI